RIGDAEAGEETGGEEAVVQALVGGQHLGPLGVLGRRAEDAPAVGCGPQKHLEDEDVDVLDADERGHDVGEHARIVYARAVLRASRLGLGCLRLPDEPPAATAVVRAALEGGVQLLDTADVYGRLPGDGERLVAAALAGWTGPVVVATKVGLTRPGEGRWIPD